MTELERVGDRATRSTAARRSAPLRAVRLDRKTVATVVHAYERERTAPHSVLPRPRVNAMQALKVQVRNGRIRGGAKIGIRRSSSWRNSSKHSSR